jgi:hypothetical protein
MGAIAGAKSETSGMAGTGAGASRRGYGEDGIYFDHRATAGTAPFTRPACPTRRCAPPLRWPALGMTVEELFGRDDAVLPVAAMPVAPLDRALADAGIEGSQLPGYDTRADGHLQVAAAIAAGLADAGSRASRPRLPMTWPSSRWPPNVSTSSSRRGTSAPARCRGS